MRYKPVKNTSRVSGSARTKPAEVRLEELMSAAQKLFLARGVEATTINEIVETASVAKGTFYHYFSSKNDIVEALAKRYTESFLATVQKAIDACAPDDWKDKLRVWIHANVETYVDTYRVHDMVYTNHHHHDRENEEKNAILDQLLEIIEGGCSGGVWEVERPRTVALLIYSGVHGATDDIIPHAAKDCSKFALHISEACMRMLPDVVNSSE